MTKTPLLVNRVWQRTESKNKEQNQADQGPTDSPGGGSSLWYEQYSQVRLAIPPGTFYYPDCRLRPAIVNFVQPLRVRQYETGWAGSSSTHATRLLQCGLSIEKGEKKKKMKITGTQRKKEKQNHEREKDKEGRPRSKQLRQVMAPVVWSSSTFYHS